MNFFRIFRNYGPDIGKEGMERQIHRLKTCISKEKLMQTSKLTQTLPRHTRNLWLASSLAACHFALNKKRLALAWTVGVTISSLLVVICFSSWVSHAGGSAGNGAVKIDFVAQEALAPIGPPGKIWVSDGVQHIRDFPLAGPVWGDLNGTLTTSFNVNLNLTTGDGTAFGIFILEVEWNGLIGTFEGRAQGTYDGFLISGHGSGHGTGDFEGMQIQAFFFNTGTAVPLIGTILLPHGD
jgi:hypothetical protein